jgi:N-acetylmuramoyl-L-alanine amidase
MWRDRVWRPWLVPFIALAGTACAADWSLLEPAQSSITRERFETLVREVYAPSGALTNYLSVSNEAVEVYSSANRTGAPVFRLAFAVEVTNVPARAFRAPDELRAARGSNDPPLQGLRVGLDPGHIGGAWARMEERFFFASREDWFLQEAALNLLVARLARERLEALGATVMLTKDGLEPVTAQRPEDFRAEAEQLVGMDPRWSHLPELFQQAAREDLVRKRQELLFYRTAEIKARAARVNDELKPDLTVAIHFNAMDTGERWELTDENGLVVFVHGNYTPGELADDEHKFFLFQKLLANARDIEVAVASVFVDELRKATGLPPAYFASGGNLHPVDVDSYLYARNLAANRQYRGPVVYLEPYFMNNRVVYARIQAGDFEGEREIEGAMRRSIFREYADAIVAALLRAYGP